MTTTERRWRWWILEKGDPSLASVLASAASRIRDDDFERRAGLMRGVRLYGPGLGMGPRADGGAPRIGGLALNLIRVHVSTAASVFDQTAPPRPWYTTDGGDYELQQRADAMTEIANAVIYQTKFDARARVDARAASLLGTVATRVLEVDGEIHLERVMPWNLLVDRRDGQDGSPRSMILLSRVDREVLRSRWAPSAEEGEDGEAASILDAINRATLGALGEDEFSDDDAADASSDRVTVLEAWHLPSAEGAGDGRHVIATSHGVLLDEPWEEDRFPFAFLRWPGKIEGFWSPGIADEIWPDQYEVNVTLERIRQMLHLIAVPRVWIEENSAVTPGPIGNAIGAERFYRGARPVFETPRAVSPELWQWIEFIWSRSFQKTGIPEMTATASKPAGIDSGKALRIYRDMVGGRLSAWLQNCQDYYLDVCELMVAMLRRSRGRSKKELTYLDPISKELRRVKWADAALPRGSYEVECFPVSSLPRDPAARLQQLDEWRNAGMIDDDSHRRMVQIPDLRADTALQTAPRDILEKIVSAVVRGESKGVRGPDGAIDDLAVWMRWLPRHILRAELCGVPAERIVKLRDLLTATEAEIERIKAGAAGGGGEAPPADPAAMMPGAPPADPGAVPPADPAAMMPGAPPADPGAVPPADPGAVPPADPGAVSPLAA